MGAIVGAALVSHIPRLMMPWEKLREYASSQMTSFFDAYKKMYEERIRDIEFDTFVIFDTHWLSLTNFVIDGRVYHKGFYTSDEVPNMISDYHFSYKGDSHLAADIHECATRMNIPTIFTNLVSLPYHYATLVPMHFLNRGKKHRVLPMSVAYTSSIEDELGYGQAIKEAILKSDKKVVLVASGGLSHKFLPMNELQDKNKASKDINNIFESNRREDQCMLELLRSGEHAWVISNTKRYRQYNFPEGRFAHYLRLVGALDGEKCKIPAVQYGDYEAAVGTGQVNLWFDVS